MGTNVIIEQEHPDFKRLMFAIDKEMGWAGGCKHTYANFQRACNRIEDLRGYKIDREKTLKYLESKGGFCDCEILMNAQFA